MTVLIAFVWTHISQHFGLLPFDRLPLLLIRLRVFFVAQLPLLYYILHTHVALSIDMTKNKSQSDARIKNSCKWIPLTKKSAMKKATTTIRRYFAYIKYQTMIKVITNG